MDAYPVAATRSSRQRAAVLPVPAAEVPAVTEPSPPPHVVEEAVRSGGTGGGRAQPRKLAEMELLSLKQISAMSG